MELQMCIYIFFSDSSLR